MTSISRPDELLRSITRPDDNSSGRVIEVDNSSERVIEANNSSGRLIDVNNSSGPVIEVDNYIMNYSVAVPGFRTSPCILKQSCFKTGASMLNDIPPGKQYLTQNGYSRSLKVICFDVDEKSLEDYILKHNNFGLMYELWKDIATARSNKKAVLSQR